MCRARVGLIALLAIASTGCGGKNLLHQYDFSARTIRSVSLIPAYPEVLTGPYFLFPGDDPLRTILRAGARVVKEVEARQVRERLVSAASEIDVGFRLEEQTLERAGRYLGTTPDLEAEETDFIFEIQVAEYGIDAEQWEAAAHFYIEAEATLIDGVQGDEIWRAHIEERDPIGPAMFGPAWGIRTVLTAAMLADLSEAEIIQALESLADYAAMEITDRLRNDLRKARDR